MISKALLLLASGAAFATAHSDLRVLGSKVDLANVEPVALHQWDPTTPKKHLGPSQYHHHPPGPSQFHHSSGKIHFPKPTDFVPAFTPSTKGDGDMEFTPSATATLSLDRGDKGDKTSPTLSLERGDSTPSLSLERQNPKATHPAKESHGDGEDNKHHPGPSKSWQHPGPSQYHHHPPGPSQYHHNKPGHKSNDGKDGHDAGRENPKMKHGSDAMVFIPYVKNNETTGYHFGPHGGASSGDHVAPGSDDGSDSGKHQYGSHGGASSGDHTAPVDGGKGQDGHKEKPHWGPSASARARLAEKTKHQEGKYALYGQAAADVCGMDEQMAGAEITACPLESGAGWDCLNLASTLESCGGCMSIGEGQDCTLIKGADTVGCVHGKCVIGTCEFGYYLDAEKGECVAN